MILVMPDYDDCDITLLDSCLNSTYDCSRRFRTAPDTNSTSPDIRAATSRPP